MTPPERPRPDALTALSLVLLAVVAVLLVLPLLGGPLPNPFLVALLLVARLGVQVLRARRDPRLRRPASWALDLILIGLLFFAASNRPPG